MNKRLVKEFEKLGKTYDIEIVEDKHWQLAFLGPTETPYFGGTFLIDIVIPNNYPFSAPKITFNTKIYHPNIDREGLICLEILNDGWKPTSTIEEALSLVRELLIHPDPNNPVMPEIAALYNSNREKYTEKAIFWTHKLAM